MDLKTGVHKFSKKLRSHLKSLGDRRVELNMFHTADPQILGTIVQILCCMYREFCYEFKLKSTNAQYY